MAGRYIRPSYQYFDNSGRVLDSGQLFFYDSGTTTLKDVYSDPDGLTPIDNPVELDGSGRTPNIYLEGSYKLIIKDKNDAQIEERDPVLAADDTTKGFAVWNAVTTYSELDIVRASDNLLYISITNSNQNNEPSASATNWTQVQLLSSYNANETYAIGDVVIDSVGDIYRSLTASNTGNTPASSPSNWSNTVSGAFGSEDITTTGDITGADISATGTITAGNDITTSRSSAGNAVTIGITNSANSADDKMDLDFTSGTQLRGRIRTHVVGTPFYGDMIFYTALDASEVEQLRLGNQSSAASAQFAGAVTIDGTSASLTLDNAGSFSASAASFIRWGDSVSAQKAYVGFGGANDRFDVIPTAGNDLYLGGDDVTVGLGNLIMGTSGKGIDFSAASGDVLDQYEENGTWTPVLSDGTNNATMVTQVGRYTRIGNMVSFNCEFNISSKGSMSGAVRVTGLPYFSINTSADAYIASAGTANLNMGAASANYGYILPNADFVLIYAADTTSGGTALDSTELNSNSAMTISGTYRVA